MQTQTKLPDGNKVLKDGEVLHIPITLMDAQQRAVAAALQPNMVGHKPGSLPLTDSDRAGRVARQAAADAKLSARWKHPAAVQPVKDAPAPATVTSQDIAAVYARRDRKLSEAWRKGGTQ